MFKKSNKVEEKPKRLSKQDMFKLYERQQIGNSIFLSIFSIFSLVCVFAYIFLITFLDIPEANQRYADTILGFLAGTLLTTIVNYYYGSSKSSKDKDAIFERLNQFRDMVNYEIENMTNPETPEETTTEEKPPRDGFVN